MIKVKVKSVCESKSFKEWFSEKDFRAMDASEQEQYLKDHPNSKFQPSNSDTSEVDNTDKSNKSLNAKDKQKSSTNNMTKNNKQDISNIKNVMNKWSSVKDIKKLITNNLDLSTTEELDKTTVQKLLSKASSEAQSHYSNFKDKEMKNYLKVLNDNLKDTDSYTYTLVDEDDHPLGFIKDGKIYSKYHDWHNGKYYIGGSSIDEYGWNNEEITPDKISKIYKTKNDEISKDSLSDNEFNTEKMNKLKNTLSNKSLKLDRNHTLSYDKDNNEWKIIYNSAYGGTYWGNKSLLRTLSGLYRSGKKLSKNDLSKTTKLLNDILDNQESYSLSR